MYPGISIADFLAPWCNWCARAAEHRCGTFSCCARVPLLLLHLSRDDRRDEGIDGDNGRRGPCRPGGLCGRGAVFSCRRTLWTWEVWCDVTRLVLVVGIIRSIIRGVKVWQQMRGLDNDIEPLISGGPALSVLAGEMRSRARVSELSLEAPAQAPLRMCRIPPEACA